MALVATLLEHIHSHLKIVQVNSGYPLKFSQVGKKAETSLKPSVALVVVEVLAGEEPEN